MLARCRPARAVPLERGVDKLDPLIHLAVPTPRTDDRLVDVNLSSLLKVLWRHKRVVVPVGIAMLLVCGLVVLMAGPTYRASASVVLLNPPALPETSAENPTIPQEFQNPYARFQDLSVIVDILVKVLGNDEVGSTMKASGLDGDFEIAANRDYYRGPIIDVAAQADSEAQAKLNAQIVIDEMQRQLTSLQQAQGTDPTYYIRINLIQPPSKATRVLSGTLRLLIVALGFAVIVTVGSGLAADARERHRKRPLEDLVSQLRSGGGDDEPEAEAS